MSYTVRRLAGGFWATKATFLAISPWDMASSSAPSTRTEPDWGLKIWLKHLSRVLLPAPLLPRMARHSPLRAAKDTSWRICRPHR